jgi:hypothetical protein
MHPASRGDADQIRSVNKEKEKARIRFRFAAHRLFAQDD